MNILLLLLLIQGSILSILLLTRKFYQIQNRYLGAFVLVVVVFSSVELLESVYLGISNGAWLLPFVLSKFSAPILLYCYASSFTINNSVKAKKLLLIPFSLGLIFSCWAYLTIEIIDFDSFTNAIYGNAISAINLLLWILYLPITYRKLRNANQEKSITKQYLLLLQILISVIIVSLFLEIMDDVNDHFHFFTNLDFFDVVDILFLSMIYFISYKAFSQPQMFQDIEKLLPKPEPVIRYASSKLSEDKLSEIQSRLKELMRNEKIYLKGDLNIQEMADLLKVSRQYLTQVINEKMECNFNDYINAFRVDEFKQRSKNTEYKNYTLLALALDSGFNSKTSFNTIFKKHTGMTPSQYRKTIEGQ